MRWWTDLDNSSRRSISTLVTLNPGDGGRASRRRERRRRRLSPMPPPPFAKRCPAEVLRIHDTCLARQHADHPARLLPQGAAGRAPRSPPRDHCPPWRMDHVTAKTATSFSCFCGGLSSSSSRMSTTALQRTRSAQSF
ncbi:hypothetical protein C1H46_012490 [Malus baccata]|uniref:Uncharacterized protein n=1 Tax=Malus baccata TaxID=106549 RepID=A0A540MST4_MALBA|nr:hypothetical protein C1H46_012490 [Malus baccata]